MTTDPALRALLFDEFGWPSRKGPGREDRDPGLVSGDIDNPAWERVTQRIAAVAAAEAAPLDVERLARALIAWRGDYGLGLTDGDREDAASLARHYAALRSPDTETAGEAG